MDVKKILFVGLGGAGQRHLRIFKECLSDDVEFSAYRATKSTPFLKSDFSVVSNRSLEEEYRLRLFSTLEEGLENQPDLVVVANPSALHFDAALKSAKRGIALFVEKPFSHNLDGFEEFQDIILKKKIPFFVSYNRRFHPFLRRIKDIVESGKLGKIMAGDMSVASHVPSWHPYEDFKQLYACRADLGGGVLLTEIHEIDLCCWYFGLPQSVYCSGGNLSSVQLDVEDTAHMILNYPDFSVSINLCFMQKHTRRSIHIAGECGYLEWNGQNNRLIVEEYEESGTEEWTDPDLQNDDMFRSQAAYFLNDYQGSDIKEYLDAARNPLSVVQAAKESMRTGQAVMIDPKTLETHYV